MLLGDHSYIQNNDSSSIKKNISYLISLCSFILFIFLNFHFLVCLLSIFRINAPHFSKFISFILLMSLYFWELHCIGYLDHFLKSKFVYPLCLGSISVINEDDQPEVAILIPVFNEVCEVVEQTLVDATNINYKNSKIYLLDDSTDQSICKKMRRLAIKFDINYIHRENRRGYKAGAINDAIKQLSGNTRYLLILDADHRPKPYILNQTIPHLESDPTLAFIQTPQYFTNNINNHLTMAYSFQQHIFHKHVCRGLHVNNSVFMCGTNFIVRLNYLKYIDYMNEKSITEDLATSFILHKCGYKSLYLDEICAKGMPPITLSAYYTQQMRWAYGSIYNLRQTLFLFFKDPRGLKLSQWWEYLIINGTWYFSGWTLFIWLIYPTIVLICGVEPLNIYLLKNLYLVFALVMGVQFATGNDERKYRFRDMFLAQGLFFSLFPVYIRASIYAIAGKTLEFKVTPKKATNAISFVQFLPQISIFIIIIISLISGIWQIITGITYTYILIVTCWSAYSTAILLCMIYFYLEDRRR